MDKSERCEIGNFCKDVTHTHDAFGWSGMPIAAKASIMSYESRFESVDKVGRVVTYGRVVLYHRNFKVPANIATIVEAYEYIAYQSQVGRG